VGWDRFLEALDADPARASRRYEELRRKLVDLFRWRALGAPEDLADETIERVARKLEAGEVLRGDVARYAGGVARLVALEAGRRGWREAPTDGAVLDTHPARVEDDDGGARGCLDRCLEELAAPARDLLLRYQLDEGRTRIDQRKAIAGELGIGLNALRIRVHRIRAQVEQCVRDCVSEAEEKGPSTEILRNTFPSPDTTDRA
jgi:DNA-directed RNA polymerase specialized sigma24 family protein